METLYFDGKPVSITLTGLEKKLARTILDLSAGEDGFELYNNDVALFEQDPGEPVFGCNFERVEHIEWKDRRQLGALLTSLEKSTSSTWRRTPTTAMASGTATRS